jgi:hypothetical protein
MSGVTLQAGEVFSGTATVGGATGQVALTQVGQVSFNTADTPPQISNVTITQDALASSLSFDGVKIESVTITAVHTNATVDLTTNDLPPNVTVPSGFTLPQTVVGTVLDVFVQTNNGFVTGTGDVGVYGISGNEVLVGVQNLTAFGQQVNVGAAILSFGTQETGTIDASFTPSFGAPCYAAGTRIATEQGEVCVEALRLGDRVVLAGGGSAPVAWLGHRRVRCRRHPRPSDVQPVRVAAHAFGLGRPGRDLLLSPDHAVFVDGVLIPVRYLLNGATVRQEDVADVTYWHVELPAHGVLLAEGLPAESYLDTGNRAAFANGGHLAWAHPDFARAAWARHACAPLVTEGPLRDMVHRRLLAQAAALGWRAIDAGGGATDWRAPALCNPPTQARA